MSHEKGLARFVNQAAGVAASDYDSLMLHPSLHLGLHDEVSEAAAQSARAGEGE